MSMYATQRRSNREAARKMMIAGVAVVAMAATISFLQVPLANWINHGGGALRSLVIHLWAFSIQLGYPLGAFLIVGSIIVSRLPEQAPQEQPPST